MIDQRCQSKAIEVIHRFIVRARFELRSGNPELAERVLDRLELLPLAITAEADQTEAFLSSLEGCIDLAPGTEFYLEDFRSLLERDP